MKVSDKEFLEWLMLKKIPVVGWSYLNGRGVLVYHNSMDSCIGKTGVITEVKETFVTIFQNEEIKVYTYLIKIRFSLLEEYYYYSIDMGKGLKEYSEKEVEEMLEKATFWSKTSQRFGL